MTEIIVLTNIFVGCRLCVSDEKTTVDANQQGNVLLMATKAARKLETISGIEQAVAMLDPLRLKLLERLQTPNSATGLARAMRLPRQRLNYHLRELERHRLVEFVEERRKGNCTERIVRATATSYLISPDALGSLATDPDRIEDRFSSTYQVAVAAKAIRDIAVLEKRAQAARKKLPTLTLQVGVRFAGAEQQQAFARDLTNAVAELAAKYHDETAPDGRRFEFYVGGYPAITKSEEAARREASDDKDNL